MKHFILSAMMVMAGMTTQAQDVVKELKADVNRSAGTNYSLPAVKVENDTPAPGGKKPFYINHYACPSSYYLQKEEYYDEPLEVFMKADSLGKLTKLGKDVLVKVLLNNREARLPLQTDCAPYYHWTDVKRYYLRKLYRYENERFNEKAKK